MPKTEYSPILKLEGGPTVEEYQGVRVVFQHSGEEKLFYSYFQDTENKNFASLAYYFGLDSMAAFQECANRGFDEPEFDMSMRILIRDIQQWKPERLDAQDNS